jgi:hypothetical protein
LKLFRGHLCFGDIQGIESQTHIDFDARILMTFPLTQAIAAVAYLTGILVMEDILAVFAAKG